MPETVNNCPLCRQSESALFEQRMDHRQRVVYRLCKNCGLVFQSPRMTAEEASVFYEHQYRTLYQGQEDPDRKDLTMQRSRAKALAAFCRRNNVLNVSRHLDIGCSAGLALQQFAQEFGSQPVGIEPGDAYRAFANKQGLKVFASLEELKSSGESLFDLVSLSHVLEHLPDPVAYLAMLKEQWLQPSGWLLIEVPNLYAHDSLEIAHLFAFSPHTLVETVQQAGYTMHATQAHGFPRSKVIPLYITLLAQPSTKYQSSPVIPEKFVTLKRRTGLTRRSLLSHFFPRQTWVPLETS